MSGRLIARAYLTEARYETLRMLRTPAFAAPFLALPAALYLLFAVVIFGRAVSADPHSAAFIFTAFTVFGVMGPGLFGFGMAVATEREQGLLTLKRALPMPPAAYLLAKMIMALLFAVAIMATMIAVAPFGQLRLTVRQDLLVTALTVLGAVPFCAIGLFLGARTTTRGAPAFVNVLYQVMLHLSGLFYPLPGLLRTLSPVWPSYHLQQLLLSVLGLPSRGPAWSHVAALAGLTVLLTMTSLRRLARVG